jgi:hypothetical protein
MNTCNKEQENKVHPAILEGIIGQKQAKVDHITSNDETHRT